MIWRGMTENSGRRLRQGGLPWNGDSNSDAQKYNTGYLLGNRLCGSID